MSILLNGDFSELKANLKREINFYKGMPTINLFLRYESKDGVPPFSIDLLESYLHEIKKIYPKENFDYRFSYTLEDNSVLDTDYCKTLETIDNYLRDNHNMQLYIQTKKESYEAYGFRKTLSANRKLESIAENIKNATNNGTPLSNFEKFMLAYEYVTQYVYNEGGDITHEETSHWIPVLEGDKIVCAGYASLLSALCDRIFPQKEVKVFEQGLSVYNKKDNKLLGGHGNNIIFINDDKYKINGMFYVDPCWDSVNEKRTDKPQAYCCIPLKDIINNKKYNLVFDRGLTNFYLSQNIHYQELVEKIEEEQKNSNPFIALSEMQRESLEDKVETFLQRSFRDKEVSDYIIQELPSIIRYDASQFTSEEKLKLDQLKDKVLTSLKKDYGDILKKYDDIRIPRVTNFPQKLIDFYNIGPDLDIINNNYEDSSKMITAFDNLAKAFNDSKAIEYTKKAEEMEIKVISLSEYIVERVSIGMTNNLINKITKDREEYIKKAKSKNTTNFMNFLNEKADSDPIPLQAFINSYKIIGERMGLNDDILEEHVQNRLIKSIKRTQLEFNVSECKSCFSTAKIEDIIKNIKNK